MERMNGSNLACANRTLPEKMNDLLPILNITHVQSISCRFFDLLETPSRHILKHVF